MKKLIFSSLLLLFTACTNNSEQISELQKKLDSLQVIVNDSYKPGFGEFMMNIQIPADSAGDRE